MNLWNALADDSKQFPLQDCRSLLLFDQDLNSVCGACAICYHHESLLF